MANKKICPYCKKEIVYQKYQQFTGHCGGCGKRPGYQETRKRLAAIISNKRKDYEFKCKKCKKLFIVSLTPYQYKYQTYKLHCSYKCANSEHIQTEQINNKRRQTILRKIKSGEIICKGLKGKLNSQYKETGCERVNREIKLKTFDKFKGICQKCGKQLIKKETKTWVAHHNNRHITREEYYDDEDRTLYCKKHHLSLHNKGKSKINNTKRFRFRLFDYIDI